MGRLVWRYSRNKIDNRQDVHLGDETGGDENGHPRNEAGSRGGQSLHYTVLSA